MRTAITEIEILLLISLEYHHMLAYLFLFYIHTFCPLFHLFCLQKNKIPKQTFKSMQILSFVFFLFKFHSFK